MGRTTIGQEAISGDYFPKEEESMQNRIRGINFDMPRTTIEEDFNANPNIGRSSAPDLQGAGAPSTTAPITQTQPQVDNEKSSLDMQRELATINALSQNFQSGGLGSAVGVGVGAGAGAVIGTYALPVIGTGYGAAAGAAVGGSIGLVVDHMLGSSAKDRIAKKQKDLKRKLIKKEQRKSNARGIAERKARLKGIGLTLEQQAQTAEDVIRNERRTTLSNLMYDIGQKQGVKKQLNANFRQQKGL